MDYFKKYRYRCEVSESWTAFDMKSVGTKITPKMRQIQLALQDNKLKLFKTLICESDAREVVNQNGCKVVDGLNMNFIRNLISNKADQRFVDLIDSVLCTDFDDCFGNNNIVSAKLNNTLIFVIQLILTPISLHPHFCNAKVSHFDLSQYQVYTTTKSQPLFVGRFKQDINVRWLLHTVNFFKFHLKAGVGEGILSDAYNNLDPHQYPQPWVGPIRSGTHILGKNWKGVHNFLVDEDLHELRSDGIRGIYCDHGEIFQDLEIFFDEEKFPAQNWLENWEEFLPSNPFQVSRSPSSGRRPSRTKTTLPNLDIKTFYGTSQCTKKAYFYGRIHAMPQQQGLIGFQRIVVLKYYPAPSGEFDFEQVYCYEGCVFPGNKVIVGRWWHQLGDPKANTTQSGPFIWWNVDRNGSGAEGTGDEALNFYEEYLNI
ncbi:hypothetical protein B0J14DRAFT_688649 [Halenospora varia]|nr:hypothetical protein B0J14DRAFT_688649 [Halenospora varia]